MPSVGAIGSAKLISPAGQCATIFINGKFTAQRTTGVQRVATRLVQALDALLLLAAEALVRWVLLCPSGSEAPRLSNIEVRCVGIVGLPLHLWEQIVLPWVARGAALVNLAGPAPALGRRHICLLHDAAVFDHPEAYTAGFVEWYRWLFGRLWRTALKLLTVSEFSRGRLAVRLGFERSSIAVVSNGGDHFNEVTSDPSVLLRHALQGKRFFLAVASNNPTKNLARLVSAFAQLEDDADVQLVIVGGHSARVFASGDGALHPPGVLRLGPIGDGSLTALYEQAVGLIFPSVYEGFGLTRLEAMSCGCPVAAAHAAAIPEVCREAALYFDPRSVEAIAVAMRHLLHEASLRDRLRTDGRLRAASRLWSDAARTLLAHVVEATTQR